MQLGCGLEGQPPDLPDAGEGACCIGAAIYGKDRCTCWEPAYDLEQQPVMPGVMMPRIPARMCGDCAFRPDSPERRGEPGHAADGDALDEMVAAGEPFACHQGIRRPVRWVHPSGAEIPGHPAAYSPPLDEFGIPYKADGTPADLCSGWLLRRVKEMQK